MDDMAGSVAALAAELKEKKKDGCESCRNLEPPDRRGIRFCYEQGCYNPKVKCAFFKKK